MTRVQLLVEAATELGEILDRLHVCNPRAAHSFIDDFEQSRSLLLQFPGSGAIVRDDIRKLRLDRHPYNLIYRVEGEFIRVYAIAHHKRKPGYWLDRID